MAGNVGGQRDSAGREGEAPRMPGRHFRSSTNNVSKPKPHGTPPCPPAAWNHRLTTCLQRSRRRTPDRRRAAPRPEGWTRSPRGCPLSRSRAHGPPPVRWRRGCTTALGQRRAGLLPGEATVTGRHQTDGLYDTPYAMAMTLRKLRWSKPSGADKGSNAIAPCRCRTVPLHLVVIGEFLLLAGADLGEHRARLVEEDERQAQPQRQPEGDEPHAKSLRVFAVTAHKKTKGTSQKYHGTSTRAMHERGGIVGAGKSVVQHRLPLPAVQIWDPSTSSVASRTVFYATSQ